VKNKLFLFVFLLVVSMLFSGCYWQEQVEANQVGVKLDDGVSVTSVVGPGRYDAQWCWFCKIERVDMSNKTVDWTDPDLLTKDNQPIGLALAITYSRRGDSESIKAMYGKYRSELFDDASHQRLVFSRVPDIAKANTKKYTLEQMLSQRSEMAKAIEDELAGELAKIHTDLVTVQIVNISVDQGYMDKLKAKSQVVLDREVAIEAALTAEERVKQTKAESEIEYELARRTNEINRIKSETYDVSERYYNLEYLTRLGSVIGNNDKFFFVPEGSPLSVVTGNGEIIPVVQP
jgi:uncharacterized membrane protein YqiK